MNEYSIIPKIQLDILSRTLLAAMERFYSNPHNLRRYEEWRVSDEGRAYVKRQEAKTRQSENGTIEP